MTASTSDATTTFQPRLFHFVATGLCAVATFAAAVGANYALLRAGNSLPPLASEGNDDGFGRHRHCQYETNNPITAFDRLAMFHASGMSAFVQGRSRCYDENVRRDVPVMYRPVYQVNLSRYSPKGTG